MKNILLIILVIAVVYLYVKNRDTAATVPATYQLGSGMVNTTPVTFTNGAPAPATTLSDRLNGFTLLQQP